MRVGLWGLGTVLLGALSCRETEKPDDNAVEDAVEPTYCETLGLSEVPFDPSGESGGFGEVAPDFTFNLLDDEVWTLSEQWTGCDNYIFVNYFSANEYPARLTRPREIQELLELAPVNTHIFVLAYPGQGEDVAALMGELESNFEAAYGMLSDDAVADWWREKVHFVVDDAWSADWMGMLNNDYYDPNNFVLWSAAIDRTQHVREVGNYCDPSTGWEQCPPFFMAYESIYFNFEAEREAELASHNADVVSMFDTELIADPNWAGERSIMEVDLPSAEDLLAYDTLHLDLHLECTGYPAGTQCPAWDYIVNLYLCEQDDPSTDEDESEVCNKEFGRWITTYWRPGRWVHDATPMMAWIQDGGTRKFAFYSQQPYNVSLDLRFSNQDKGVRPIGIEEVFRGGALDDFYNWGSHHTLTDSEWRQWTVEDQQDVFTIQSTEQVEDDRDFMFIYGTIQWQHYETALDENGWEWLDITTIMLHNETEQYWITEDNNDPDLEEYHRIDYTWTGDAERPLAVCLTEDSATTIEEAELATEHCMVDDPTTCHPRADRDNLRSGCNFGPWTMLTSEYYDPADPQLETHWVEERRQQYWLMDNGAGNDRYPNKDSRWDWFVEGETLYFCATEPNLSDVADISGVLWSCSEDNANTDTVDESKNCTLQADRQDLERGCNGGAWRKMNTNDQATLDEATPTGDLTEIWHEDKLPLEFTPPEGTTKVELAGVVSGHGFGADTLNCAEFCDHQHQFTVNDGEPVTKTHPEAGTPMGCADQVAIGTVPNQSGTWVYGRSGWCPGMEVPVWRNDFTGDVDLSGSNTLSYLGLVRGEVYHPSYTSGTFRPRVDMRSYLVYYR